MTSSEGTAERQLAGQDSAADNSSKTAGIVTRICWVRPSDAQQVEHSPLGLENRTTTERTDLD
jgi:hypothetical protein